MQYGTVVLREMLMKRWLEVSLVCRRRLRTNPLVRSQLRGPV